jgi:hypothetical protein
VPVTHFGALSHEQAKSQIICAYRGMVAYLEVLDLSNLIIRTEIRMESGL